MLFCSLTKFCPCLGMNSGHEVSRLPSMVCFLLTSSENFFTYYKNVNGKNLPVYNHSVSATKPQL